MGWKLIRITSPTRIHVSLLSLHEGAERKYGGFGFAIDKKIAVRAERSRKVEIVDLSGKLSSGDMSRIKLLIERALYNKGVSVWIESMPNPHSGLGTGTSLCLSVIEAALLAVDESYDAQELVLLSGRGRTSGVGVETYFRGGAVFDIGVKGGLGFYPSANSPIGEDIAKNLFRCDFPNWKVELLHIDGFKGLSGFEEQEFFNQTLPLNPLYSYESLYRTVMGLIPSCLDGDLKLFHRSVSRLQEMDWKSAEVSSLGEDFQKKFISLRNEFPHIGMSSMGPLLYSVTDRDSPAIESSAREYGFRCEVVEPDNQGRVISDA